MASETPVQRGEELHIAAATWNTVLEMVKGHRRGPALHTPPVPGGPRGQAVVTVRNDTGADLAEFATLGLNGVEPLVSAESLPFEFARGPVFSGLLATLDTDQPAVTLEPIPAGECGRAAILGVVPVTVTVWDAALNGGTGGVSPGDYLRCSPGGTSLVKGTWGCARLLWSKGVSTGDNGPRRGVALLGGDATDYDLEVVTDVLLVGSGCTVTLTETLTRFRKGLPDVSRTVGRGSYTIPSTCVEVPVGTPTATSTTTCVNGVATTTTTFNFSTQKVRVLACGACP